MQDAVQTKGAFGIVSVTPFMFAGYRYLQQNGIPSPVAASTAPSGASNPTPTCSPPTPAASTPTIPPTPRRPSS
jgi:hypothetical protein